jgi:hypothetical protein
MQIMKAGADVAFRRLTIRDLLLGAQIALCTSLEELGIRVALGAARLMVCRPWDGRSFCWAEYSAA